MGQGRLPPALSLGTGARIRVRLRLASRVFALARTVRKVELAALLWRKDRIPEHLTISKGCALSSVEEHFLHTEGVAGSSPAARTISIHPAQKLLPGGNPSSSPTTPVV
jgi:hypothetical protein